MILGNRNGGAPINKLAPLVPSMGSTSRFSIGGSADAALYGTFTGSPNSAGWVTEIAYLPFSYGGPSLWPWLNMRIGLQYTLYNKFDGATTNFNGAGRNAHNNNTIFAYAWIMF
jgi:hypothetical protein